MITNFLKKIVYLLPEPIPSKVYRFRRILKYGLVGITNTTVDFVFYKLFIYLFLQNATTTALIQKLDLTIPTTAKIISTEIAIIWGFILNSKYTFADKTDHHYSLKRRFILFQLTLLGSLALAATLIQILTKSFGIEYNTYYFLATIPVSLAWNYTFNYLFTWRQKSK